MRMTNPLELFTFLSRLGDSEGPEDIRFFKGDDFLFASFNNGQEQIVHVNAMSKARLAQYLHEVQTNFGVPGAE